MKTKSINRNLATLAAVVAFSGCAWTGYRHADETGQRTADLRDEIVTVKQAVDGAMANLTRISETATSDPRPAFAAFAKAVDRVEAGRARTKRLAEGVNAQGSSYFAQWERELANITNPETRQRAEARKTKLAEAFKQITPLLQQAKADFDPFLSDLKDLRTLLSVDLTVTGVDAASGNIKKTRESGTKVQGSLDELLDEMNGIAATLTGAKDGK